ncbi:hypothetical protein KPL71_003847 [Citrus sinensis]|uniref:Uncharacterized protein n=1 Tax=Citrus sinensis TaxID=2711 RepID=A0ACB8N1B0_CITSI|nr:hypothetical protein KPL71_003847 [Citrus sinensis]
MTGRKNKAEMELMAALCWSIWHSRNLLIFKNKREDSQSSIAAAEVVVQAYRRIQMPLMQEGSRHEDVVQKRWKPPPTSRLTDQQRTGLGIVIRNPEGKVVAAAMKTTIFLDKVDFAEAEAIQFGLEIAEHAGCIPVIMESDSQEIVSLMSYKKSTRAEIFWVVAEVQDRIKSLKHVKVQYTPRNCNSVAHSLAKLALELNDFVYWVDDIPTQFLYLFTELME